MKTPTRSTVLFFLVGFLAVQLASAANWPAWRGANADGISTEKNLPVKWSKDENVRWRVPLPEAGNSTPIVWGDRIFVTQPVGDRRTLMCLSRVDGKLLWQVGVATKEKEPTHGTNPYCSASPVTDGERVIVSFASDGLFCYDFSGRELWKRTDLGRQIHIWGGAASPVIYQNLCFLNFGPGETTCLLAVDKKTGKTVWKNDEAGGDAGAPPPAPKEPPADKKAAPRGKWLGSWTTPVIINEGGRDSLIMSWPGRLCSLDPTTGKERWNSTSLTPLVYTSPIHSEGIVVAMGGFGGAAVAVRTGGSGDVPESKRLWHHPRSAQRIGSGVIHEGHIYIHNDPGTAMCLNLETGKEVWNERLVGRAASGVNWSSVLLADGKCYTITQGGDCFVFKASTTFELIAKNPLDERSNSSIVPSNGELFIRTHKALWCIGGK
ncbi:MAG: PQQ-binding-like beta-propeller repeat protein [Verrucomicrobia bacterium]|nr:PQQ-binding-like beta-propeller repeat protein [Verrucomicrobiota bacterium]